MRLLPRISSGIRTTIGSRTFDGTAGNGAIGTATFFDVTGQVLVEALVVYCTSSLTDAGGTATISLGVVGDTAGFVAATTAINIDTGEFWIDTGPVANMKRLPTAVTDTAISQDIVANVATEAVTGGTLRITVFWRPISSDGDLVLASGVS